MARHPFDHVLTTRFKVRVVRKALASASRGRLLDVGCGGGFMLSKLEEPFRFSVGIDMSVDALGLARNYCRSELLSANAERIPLKDQSMDCVVSTDAFEHIPDDTAAIQEIERVLLPGGCAVFYVPCQKGVLANTKLAGLFHRDEASYLLDQRAYTMESLRALAAKTGLQVEFLGYHNVFFQELFTQGLKWAGMKMGKQYQSQADIGQFTSSRLFGLYRWVLLPAITLLVRAEELLCENLFGARIPGHRLVMKCRKLTMAEKKV